MPDPQSDDRAHMNAVITRSGRSPSERDAALAEVSDFVFKAMNALLDAGCDERDLVQTWLQSSSGGDEVTWTVILNVISTVGVLEAVTIPGR